ncbi:MAG: hypothetical protein HQK55_12240 [Deltaproteobacteria bacterium]|nr:hypothetical protein [Deltaproteobacteria bacterium]
MAEEIKVIFCEHADLAAERRGSGPGVMKSTLKDDFCLERCTKFEQVECEYDISVDDLNFSDLSIPEGVRW